MSITLPLTNLFRHPNPIKRCYSPINYNYGGITPLYFYAYLKTETIIITHEARNNTPPIGVMAPKTDICVTLKTYKLPEKKIIPANIK